MTAEQPLPRYMALADQLKAQMSNLAPNVLLPSEDQLAQQFEVSRVTVRRALGILEQSGLVDRQRGRGTVVSPPKIKRTLFPTMPIEEDFRSQGLSLHSEVLSVAEGEASERVRARLGWSEGAAISTISLVRKIARRVVCLDRRHVSAEVMRRIELDRVDEVPMAVLIAKSLGQPIAHHRWELEFLPAAPEPAKVLGLTPDTLVVVSSGVDYLDDWTPVCATEVFYRIDRVSFSCTSPYRPAQLKDKGES